MAESPWKNREFARKNISHIDERFRSGTVQETAFLMSELAIVNNARIIDLGCGTGRHCIELARHGHHVVGIDISDVLLAEAKRRSVTAMVSIEFIPGDVRNLGELLRDQKGTFDGAMCLCESAFGVLGTDTQDLQFLNDVYRLLAPDGKFILTTFNGIRRYRTYEEHDEAFDYIKGVIHWYGPAEEYGQELREETRIYTPSEVITMFELAGFRKTEIYGCSPGNFSRQTLRVNDIEMMAVGMK